MVNSFQNVKRENQRMREWEAKINTRKQKNIIENNILISNEQKAHKTKKIYWVGK